MMTRRDLASVLAWPAAFAARARAQSAAADASTTIDADGTAHITRAVPVPKTVSPEAYAKLVAGESWAPDEGTKGSLALIEKMRAAYPVEIEHTTVAGVKAKWVTPKNAAPEKKDRVLVCLHGGGFHTDSGSFLEAIPIAGMTRTRVISVEYRLGPKFPFPIPVEDSVAVYREVLKTYAPRKIAVYGTSAGAILTAEVAVQLRKLGLPLPAALGFFAGFADMARPGDAGHIYSIPGFRGFRPTSGPTLPDYVGKTDPRDPVLSPMYADLKGFPPTLCMTGTRDICLSGTVDFHRALLRAGVDARLMVFDAMPHAHWYSFDLPESREALEAQARFLDHHLG
jgi:monoterpene epsilon-lactone hydrolase